MTDKKYSEECKLLKEEVVERLRLYKVRLATATLELAEAMRTKESTFKEYNLVKNKSNELHNEVSNLKFNITEAEHTVKRFVGNLIPFIRKKTLDSFDTFDGQRVIDGDRYLLEWPDGSLSEVTVCVPSSGWDSCQYLFGVGSLNGPQGRIYVNENIRGKIVKIHVEGMYARKIK